MILHPAVIVHGLADATHVLALGLPVTLLSAPGAAGFAGCLWWRAVVEAARAAHPDTGGMDILDCADAAGAAMAALRSGIPRLVVSDRLAAWPRIAQIAAAQGGFVLAAAPPALDLAARDGRYRLRVWLQGGGSPVRPA